MLGLGEEVSQVVLSAYITDGDGTQVLLLLEVVILDCNVLGFFVGRFILSQLNGGLVVLPDGGRSLRKKDVKHNLCTSLCNLSLSPSPFCIIHILCNVNI